MMALAYLTRIVEAPPISLVASISQWLFPDRHNTSVMILSRLMIIFQSLEAYDFKDLLLGGVDVFCNTQPPQQSRQIVCISLIIEGSALRIPILDCDEALLSP